MMPKLSLPEVLRLVDRVVIYLAAIVWIVLSVWITSAHLTVKKSAPPPDSIEGKVERILDLCEGALSPAK
jgi:hypothetical protein